VVDNDDGVDERCLMLLESGHTTVCRDVVRHRVGEGKVGGEGVGSDAPLSIICEDGVCLAECYKLFPCLWILVYVRMELLAQLTKM